MKNAEKHYIKKKNDCVDFGDSTDEEVSHVTTQEKYDSKVEIANDKM